MSSVVVVGSGAAGLTAAVAAAQSGAEVTVVERAPVLGGTTALSGGLAWMPANRLMAAEGVDDSPAEAREYLQALRLGDVDDELVDYFADQAAAVADWLDSTTGLSWQTVPYPDYHPELPGGKPGHRPLEPQPREASPELDHGIRTAPNVTAPITYRELATGDFDRAEVADRSSRGVITMGRSMIASLVEAAEALGAAILTGVGADGLAQSGGTVNGVRIGPEVITGRVILASGGFERDPALVRAFLRGPMTGPVGAPGMDGTALRLALAAGAELGNMAEAWWCPAMTVPGEAIDGEPFHRLVLTERARPRSLMVDSRGRRFANEARNYNDVGRAMQAFDPTGFQYPAATAWLVFDSGYRRRYHLGPLRRDGPDPEWLHRADSLDELATAIGVDREELAASVVRFNQLVGSGDDPDFGRGRSIYDCFVGDPTAPHPTLGPVEEPPFYAVRLHPGCLGTKGGPRTDIHGQVRHQEGGLIEGLYAVGNAAASPLGAAYPGAGGTIGPMLVAAHAAGTAAAS
ncbi:FAD-dependent oxidoreductase [Candidatus Poriferisocius sp.]|uniref:FAD-dependent oxidoreductase n=1 Tax=Candidatus Poriferisocius sp. TaxID=3101276 RepID=UPI003B015999